MKNITSLNLKGPIRNILTPVTLSGVVTPCNQELVDGRSCDYKLVTSSGLEYFIVADSEWRSVLSTFCWEVVNIIGLLNICNMTVIPQKVFPKGPTGEKEKLIEVAEWDRGKFVRKAKKIAKTVNDFVLVPGVLMAMIVL